MPGILLSGLVALVVSLLLTPLVRDAALRWGLYDKADGFRKLHQGQIPRLGGIAILLSYAWSLGLLKFLDFGGEIPGITDLRAWWLGLAAVATVFATGLIDDLIGLNAWQKVLGQATGSVIAWFAGVEIHSIQGHPLDTWLALPLTIFWLVACSNAFNLIDGMDGLAAGVGFFSAATICISAFVYNNHALVAVTLPLCGALLGFLRFNFNPASIFMGDNGSLTLGFMLGCFGVMWSEKTATLLGMTAPVMAMALPLLDASVSIVRRMLRNKPVLQGDRRHMHHRLLDRGMTPRRAVLAMYGACIIAATLALLATGLRNQLAGWVIVLFCALIVFGIQFLGYVEFGSAAQMVGSFRRLLDTEVQLQVLKEKLDHAETVDECWGVLRGTYAQFGYQGIKLRLDDGSYEENPSTSLESWQVRIPLGGREYVNFFGGFHRDKELRTVGAFISVVQSGLMERLRHLRSTDIAVAPIGPRSAVPSAARKSVSTGA